MVTGANAGSNYIAGINIGGANYCHISNNNALYNFFGISVSCSSNNILTNNIARSNNNCGIHLYNADNNNISCNWVAFNNASGFYLTDGSIGNTIEHNNIMKNGDYNAASGGYEWQLYKEQNYVVTAKNNYWGPGMNNSTVDASICDEDEGKGRVEFYPFVTNPDPCAPISELITLVLLLSGLLMLVGYVVLRRKNE